MNALAIVEVGLKNYLPWEFALNADGVLQRVRNLELAGEERAGDPLEAFDRSRQCAIEGARFEIFAYRRGELQRIAQRDEAFKVGVGVGRIVGNTAEESITTRKKVAYARQQVAL